MGFGAPAIILTELTERRSSRVREAEISGAATIPSDAGDAGTAGSRHSVPGLGSISDEAGTGLKAEVSLGTEPTTSVAGDAAIPGTPRRASGPGSIPIEAEAELKAEVSLGTEAASPAAGDGVTGRAAAVVAASFGAQSWL
jgi:hypothetical protein